MALNFSPKLLPTGQVSVVGTLLEFMKAYIKTAPTAPLSDVPQFLDTIYFNLNPNLQLLDQMQIIQSPNFSLNLETYIESLNSSNTLVNDLANSLCNQFNQFNNYPLAFNYLEIVSVSSSGISATEYYVNANVTTVSCGTYSEAGNPYGVAVTMQITYQAQPSGGSFGASSTIYKTILLPFADTPSIQNYINSLVSGTSNVGMILGSGSYLSNVSSDNIPPYTPAITINGVTPQALELLAVAPTDNNSVAQYILNGVAQALADALGTSSSTAIRGSIYPCQTVNNGTLTPVQSCSTPFKYLGQFYGVAGSAYTGSSLTFTSQQESYNVPVIVVPFLISGSSQSSYTNLYQIADSFARPFNISAVITFNSETVNPPTFPMQFSALSNTPIPSKTLNVQLAIPVNVPPNFLTFYINQINQIAESLYSINIDSPATFILSPAIQNCYSLSLQSPTRGNITFQNVQVVVDPIGNIQAVIGYPAIYILGEDKVVNQQCINVADAYLNNGQFNIAPVPTTDVAVSKLYPDATGVQLFGNGVISGTYNGVTVEYSNQQQIGKVNNNTVDLMNVQYYPSNYLYEIATPSGLEPVTATPPKQSYLPLLGLLGLGALGVGVAEYLKKHKTQR
jgi:hypothetical protein